MEIHSPPPPWPDPGRRRSIRDKTSPKAPVANVQGLFVLTDQVRVCHQFFDFSLEPVLLAMVSISLPTALATLCRTDLLHNNPRCSAAGETRRMKSRSFCQVLQFVSQSWNVRKSRRPEILAQLWGGNLLLLKKKQKSILFFQFVLYCLFGIRSLGFLFNGLFPINTYTKPPDLFRKKMIPYEIFVVSPRDIAYQGMIPSLCATVTRSRRITILQTSSGIRRTHPNDQEDDGYHGTNSRFGRALLDQPLQLPAFSYPGQIYVVIAGSIFVLVWK